MYQKIAKWTQCPLRLEAAVNAARLWLLSDKIVGSLFLISPPASFAAKNGFHMMDIDTRQESAKYCERLFVKGLCASLKSKKARPAMLYIYSIAGRAFSVLFSFGRITTVIHIKECTIKPK